MVSLQKILSYIFVSKVRIKCLRYFIFHQDVPIHLRAASRSLGEEINAVRRELMRLNEIKLLRVDIRGNKKYFSLNPHFPFFEELSSMFLKSEGLGGAILKAQPKLGNIYFCALMSGFINGVKIDKTAIDMIIVGDVDVELLSSLIQKEEETLGKEVNYTILKLSEFNLRKKRRDPFIFNLLLDTKVLVIGKRDDYVAV